MYIATQLWYSSTNDETKEVVMNVTQYRGYNLVTGDTDEVQILHGARPLTTASDEAGAHRIIDAWLDAP
jgi:uncharacterized protein with NRDE domain